MKTGTHPKYQTCSVHCACGNTFTTRSTSSRINVDICSSCHPFFTGKQKLIDTEGRVERFTKRFGTVTAADRKKMDKDNKAAKAVKSPKKAAANA